MKRRTVIISPEAEEDLLRIHDWIADHGGLSVALSYLERLESWCLALDLASERGHQRNDIRPGLRVVDFERRVTVAFTVDDDRVTILRPFYGGQDWENTLS